MKLQLFLASVLISTKGFAQDTVLADEVTDNYPGVNYEANLDSGSVDSISGWISAVSADDGTGVTFYVHFTGFSDFSTSNYSYHIHAKPVPSDGNCTGTGGHFDPYHAGATSSSPSTYKCDPTQSTLCELGDLSGKHGNINSTSITSGSTYSAEYLDTFLSIMPGDTAFFGNLSIVVHRQADNARLKCGNFTMVQGNSTNGSSSSSNGTITSSSNNTYTWSSGSTYPTSAVTTNGGQTWSQGTNVSSTPYPTMVYTGQAHILQSKWILGVTGVVTMMLAAIL